MSPGATFERVYHELKRMLTEGEFPPGAPIEPAVIGKRIAASITPIRDALHRLTGERLVEAPNHNGFRVLFLTETALRDLYKWNGLVLDLAARASSSGFAMGGDIQSGVGTKTSVSTAALFLKIAQSAGSVELTNTIASLSDRLAIFRRVEALVLDAVEEELFDLTKVAVSGERTALLGALKRYHRRRSAAAAEIIGHVMLLPGW